MERQKASLPARGVWIEIYLILRYTQPVQVSLPARGVWIEILDRLYSCDLNTSLPARGVWIEIYSQFHEEEALSVTPREGSVD